MVYTTSLQTMVFCAADPQGNDLLIRRNALWLQQSQITDPAHPNQGAWAYTSVNESGVSGEAEGDRSNSQFALLALHEAERVGVEVDDRTWTLAHRYWINTQREGESWSYTEEGEHRQHDMCGHRLAGDRLRPLLPGRRPSDGGRPHPPLCRAGKHPADRNGPGLAGLRLRFSVRRNPTGAGRGQEVLGNSWLLYYLYGLERVGRLTGRRFIGKHDWYREGAEYLVSLQDDFEGYWKGVGYVENNPHIATSFALLFLGKGRRPVVIAKFMHGAGDDWNRHRNDAANLTRFVEQQWGRDLTWQTIKPTATAVDLLETPVLLLTGREALDLTKDQKDNLRTYVERGGFVFAVANTNGDDFDRSFRDLMVNRSRKPRSGRSRQTIRSGTRNSRSIRRRCRCWGSTPAAARVWCTARRTCRACGS